MSKDLELKIYLRAKKRVMRHIRKNHKKGTPQKNNATALANQAHLSYKKTLWIIQAFKREKKVDYISGIAYLPEN